MVDHFQMYGAITSDQNVEALMENQNNYWKLDFVECLGDVTETDPSLTKQVVNV